MVKISILEIQYTMSGKEERRTTKLSFSSVKNLNFTLKFYMLLVKRMHSMTFFQTILMHITRMC